MIKRTFFPVPLKCHSSARGRRWFLVNSRKKQGNAFAALQDSKAPGLAFRARATFFARGARVRPLSADVVECFLENSCLVSCAVCFFTLCFNIILESISTAERFDGKEPANKATLIASHPV